jgi:DNA-binding transcriptional ArsR family regulator
MVYNNIIMDIYTAIADPTRRHIVEMLARNGHLSASDISSHFKISPPAVSQHLKVLREAKIVDMEKRAQQRIYSINPMSIEEISQWIEKVKKRWEEKFSRLENILEKEKKKGGEKNE